jgi:hypothetical protein
VDAAHGWRGVEVGEGAGYPHHAVSMWRSMRSNSGPEIFGIM